MKLSEILTEERLDEITRRGFLKALGGTAGAVALAGVGKHAHRQYELHKHYDTAWDYETKALKMKRDFIGNTSVGEVFANAAPPSPGAWEGEMLLSQLFTVKLNRPIHTNDGNVISSVGIWALFNCDKKDFERFTLHGAGDIGVTSVSTRKTYDSNDMKFFQESELKDILSTIKRRYFNKHCD